MGLNTQVRPAPAAIDEDHFYVDGMVMCLPIFEASQRKTPAVDLTTYGLFDYITKEHLTSTYLSNPVVGFDYDGIYSSASTSANRFGFAFPVGVSGLWKTFNDYTIMARITKTGSVATYEYAFASDTYGNDALGTENRHFLIIRPKSSGTALIWAHYNGANGLPSTSFTWNVGETKTVAITRNGSTNEVWVNGGEVYGTVENSTAFNCHRPYLLNHWYNGTWQGYSNCSIHYFYVWNRGMTYDEILNLEQDPWQMFDRTSSAKYFDLGVSVVIPPQVYTMNAHSL